MNNRYEVLWLNAEQQAIYTLLVAADFQGAEGYVRELCPTAKIREVICIGLNALDEPGIITTRLARSDDWVYPQDRNPREVSLARRYCDGWFKKQKRGKE